MSLELRQSAGDVPRAATLATSCATSWALAPWLMLAVVIGIAILERHLLAANTDVSWLLTAGENVLDGRRLYADVIETNPPIAVLSYLPGILIARGLGVAPETVTDGLVFLAVIASLATVAVILRRSRVLHNVAGWPLAIFALAVLVLLPMQTFGQREHIALIALLPALAVVMGRANGEPPPAWAILIAGLGAGVTLAFKPYFAIPVAAGPIVCALGLRSWRPLFAPETLVAAAVVVLYGALTVVFYPDYFTVVVPMVRDVYLKLQIPLAQLLTNVAMPIFLATLLAAWMLKRATGLDSTFLILGATAIGFGAAFLLQRKGWPYHSYPMIALALMALAYAIATHRWSSLRDRGAGLAGLVALVVAFPGGLLWFNVVFDMRELEAPVEAIAAHPKILMLSGEPGFGHPLVRAVHGVWVSRQQALWVRNYIDLLKRRGLITPEAAARLEGYAARERAWLIADFKRQPPDVVLIDTLTSDWRYWAETDPEIAALLQPYRITQTVTGVDILRRAD